MLAARYRDYGIDFRGGKQGNGRASGEERDGRLADRRWRASRRCDPRRRRSHTGRRAVRRGHVGDSNRRCRPNAPARRLRLRRCCRELPAVARSAAPHRALDQRRKARSNRCGGNHEPGAPGGRAALLLVRSVRPATPVCRSSGRQRAGRARRQRRYIPRSLRRSERPSRCGAAREPSSRDCCASARARSGALVRCIVQAAEGGCLPACCAGRARRCVPGKENPREAEPDNRTRGRRS